MEWYLFCSPYLNKRFVFNILNTTSHCFSDPCSACDWLLGDERGNKFPHGGKKWIVSCFGIERVEFFHLFWELFRNALGRNKS